MQDDVIVGWGNILETLGVRPELTDKLPVEKWGEWMTRKGWEMTSQGMPVFFLPMLDNQPRILRGKLLSWAQSFSETLFIEHDLRERYRAMQEQEQAQGAQG